MSSSASASGKYNYDYDNPVTNRDSSGVAHTVSNCYYNNTLYTYTVTDSTGVSTEFMQSEDFLNLIASFTVPETKWVTGSDGYPTLEACGKGTVTFTSWENMKKAAYHDANLKVSMTRGGVTSGTIYYTTDGTDPRSSSTRKSTTAATAAVTLSGDMVLSAVVKSGELYGTVTRTEFAYLPGDGDNVDPYLILTKKGLDAVRLEPSAYYQLATDLTFTEADYELGAVAHNGWTPIPEFTGTFDGAGHAITGLKGTKGGLISTNKGMITSLRMLDHKLYSANSTGPIANTNYTDGVITRCYARSAFTLDDLPSVSKEEAKSGGIVGSNNGVVSYCKTEGVVPAMQVQNAAGDHAIGGIVGTGGTVNNCVSTALLVSKSSSTVEYIHIGGIAGESAKASNCLALHSIYEYSSLDYQGYLGGIVGGYYPNAASANYCVTGGYDFVSAKNEDRFYCGTYVYSGNDNSCYKIESGNRPSDFADLDFTSNWMFTDEGLMVQGVMDADGHCYSLVDSEDATCTKEGTAYVKCDLCGTTKFCKVPMVEHIAVTSEAVEPTCTTSGLTAGEYCSVCGEVIVEQTVVDALGHTEVVDAAVDATCTEPGLTEGKHCEICGVLVAQETIPATGHTYTKEEKQSTCTEDGYVIHTCTACGDTATTTLKAPGHSYDKVVTEATCFTGGYTTYTCSRCGDSYVGDETEATDHNWLEANCIAPRICENCGLIQGEPAYGACYDGDDDYAHRCDICFNLISDCEGSEISDDGYCTVCGRRVRPGYDDWAVCPNCSNGYDHGGMVVGHYCLQCGMEVIWGCVTDGGHYCVICGEVKSTCMECDYDGNHECDACWEPVAELCEDWMGGLDNNGLECGDHFCDVCGRRMSYCLDVDLDHRCDHCWKNFLGTSGHDEITHEGKEATCKETGWTEYKTCSVCDYTTYEEIHTLPHTEVVDQGVAATCVKTGLTEGKHCSVCNEVLISQREIPVSETHAYEDGVCADCGAEDPSAKLEITIDVVGASNGANVTAPEGGWKAGANTFHVSCDKACVVVVSYDNGKTYERLPATKDGDKYAFTAEDMAADTVVKVALSGDVNLDGQISMADRVAIARAIYSDHSSKIYQDLSGEAEIIADVNMDGEISMADRVAVARAIYGDKTSKIYQALKWEK